ncbi:YciI family protein [Streptomyces sp. NPDC048392]|uniref:YciI family protein n=1 Tax=Streptomyces sp. NPDC048392 TaxID=3365543 RepID=UPI00371C8FE3
MMAASLREPGSRLAIKFVLELSYTAPLEAVDAVLEDHVAWLDGLYEQGVVLASGSNEPRDGGVILAIAGDRPGAGSGPRCRTTRCRPSARCGSRPW